MNSSLVALVKCDSYAPHIVEKAVRDGIALIGGIETILLPHEKVLLKPNILKGAEPDRAVTTHPEVFRAVAKIVKEYASNVRYGDSPGDPISTMGSYKKSGIAQVADELNIPTADFDHGKDCGFSEGIATRRLTIANAVLESDAVISLPKLKTHGLTRMTGAIKNQYGCIPGMVKGQYHAQFPDVFLFSKLLVDICRYVKPRLYVVDACIGMEGNGPQSGDPRKIGCLIISTDPVAADTIGCMIMNLDPSYVPPIVYGNEAGLGNCDRDNITIVGENIKDYIIKDYNVVRKAPSSLPKSRILGEVRRLFIPRPVIDKSKCIVCKKCIEVCPVDPKVLSVKQSKREPQYDYRRCIRCYCCQELCPAKAIYIHEPKLKKMLPFLSYISLFFSVFHSRKSSQKKGT
jgi:uncharacterized protein (DUF362 family)/NAD-dependent dihydropyrimidine dehydrogenase PreA subunit